MLSHYDSLYSIYKKDRMILHGKRFVFYSWCITLTRLFENVIYRPKSIFLYDITVLSRPNITFYPLAFLHQTLNDSADEYHKAIFG